jgi:hypothetical protein
MGKEPGDPVIDLHPEANGDEGCVGADPRWSRRTAERTPRPAALPRRRQTVT